MVIVGGGPSLRTVKALEPGRIVALNGVHDYLLAKGVKPWGMVICDPREDNARFVRNPQPGVLYFIASQCHPAVFDALEGFDVVLWNNGTLDAITPPVLNEIYGRSTTIVGGGTTVGMRALELGWVMGFRSFHLYGMDSCLSGDVHHAYEQSVRGGTTDEVVKIEIG